MPKISAGNGVASANARVRPSASFVLKSGDVRGMETSKQGTGDSVSMVVDELYSWLHYLTFPLHDRASEYVPRVFTYSFFSHIVSLSNSAND